MQKVHILWKDENISAPNNAKLSPATVIRDHQREADNADFHLFVKTMSGKGLMQCTIAEATVKIQVLVVSLLDSRPGFATDTRQTPSGLVNVFCGSIPTVNICIVYKRALSYFCWHVECKSFLLPFTLLLASGVGEELWCCQNAVVRTVEPFRRTRDGDFKIITRCRYRYLKNGPIVPENSSCCPPAHRQPSKGVLAVQDKMSEDEKVARTIDIHLRLVSILAVLHHTHQGRPA